ncbi:unnamed protein product [Diabrotica balteata]|uniref:Uncharacterized protein n=1 Tax=Diabrotica balteata TaxID=107213 RepID=A0A9N9XCX1_DIABA|nr:unnamed protein product [Diabrotica balteata]
MLFNIFLYIALFIQLCDFSQTFVMDKNSNKSYDLDWQCDTICSGSGGRARFDPKNKICKCTMDKNTDETDILLMQKNAENMGLQIITCENYNKEMEKRDVKKEVLSKEDQVASVNSILPKFNTLNEEINKMEKQWSPNTSNFNQNKPSTVAPENEDPSTTPNINIYEGKITNYPIRGKTNYTARLIELSEMYYKPVLARYKQGKLKPFDLKPKAEWQPKSLPRMGFVETEKEESKIQKAMNLVKEKQKELFSKLKSRNSKLLRRNQLDNHEDQAGIIGKPFATFDKFYRDKAHKTRSSIIRKTDEVQNGSNKGIIVQPPGTYDE